jgi:hypothetical protein
VDNKPIKIKGHVNPRSSGNNEPMECLGFDIHIQYDWWDQFVDDENLGWRDSQADWIAVGLLLRSEGQKTSRNKASHDPH